MRGLEVMVRHWRLVIALCGMAFLSSSCLYNSNGNVVFDPPHCRIVSQSDLQTGQFGSWPTISFTIENDGEGGVANSIGVSVKLKKGNFIADEGSAFVSSLQKGESITEEIRFTKIKSTSDYSSATVRLYWYDSDGGFYED